MSVTQNAVTSWKTTAIGWIGGAIALLEQAQAFLDSNPETVMTLEGIVAAIALIGIGTIARDGDVSSEKVGAS